MKVPAFFGSALRAPSHIISTLAIKQQEIKSQPSQTAMALDRMEKLQARVNETKLTLDEAKDAVTRAQLSYDTAVQNLAIFRNSIR